MLCDKFGLIRPQFDQPQYNMFTRHRVEQEYEVIYEKWGYGLTTWSPLSSGVLTGKYQGMKNGEEPPKGSRLALEAENFNKRLRGLANDTRLETVEALGPIAAEVGCSLAQLAILWCVKNPHVSTVILGATSVEQLDENLASMRFKDAMTDEVMAKIETVLGNKPEPDGVTMMTRRLRNLQDTHGSKL